jgi:hypothetical protein
MNSREVTFLIALFLLFTFLMCAIERICVAQENIADDEARGKIFGVSIDTPKTKEL